ncbi:MAG: AMP-binding protein [bacterium]
MVKRRIRRQVNTRNKAMNDGLETLPQYFLSRMKERGKNTVAMRKKYLGIWNEYSWEQCYQHIKHFSMGLSSLGLLEGQTVCIIGDNDPEWYWAELAALSIGAVVVGIFPDSILSEIEYIINHSETKIVIAEDQEQVDKFLTLMPQIPSVEKVIYWDPKGMWGYEDNPYLINFNRVEALGKEYRNAHPDFFEEKIREGRKTNTALCLYTSGTTGLPKGVLISHEYLVRGIKRWIGEVIKNEKKIEYVSFMSPAWIADQLLGIANWTVYGIVINFPEEPETVLENIREIGATLLLFGPRQWEDLISKVQVNVGDAHYLKRLCYKASLSIGYKIADCYFSKKRSPYLWRILYQIAKWTTLNPLRDQLGLSHLKAAYTAGSLLGPDVFKFYTTIGVGIREVYGMTEVTPVTTHREFTKLGTVGKPHSDTDVKISNEGEILITSSCIFDGYLKNREATESALVNGKWIKTGDSGIIDEEGYLVVMDRLKDMMTLKDGTLYSPSYIENRLKFSIYIRDAMVTAGKGGKFIFAIIVIDFDNVGKWAEKNKISYTTLADLSQRPEVYYLLKPAIIRSNQFLPKGTGIEKYSILHKEFDPDEGDLTRSRKLKRISLEKRYADLIEAAYKGKTEIILHDKVTYQDGREGKTTINLLIKDV